MGHMQATVFWMISKPSTLIKYGLLYNWYAATDVRNICSAGWHIPTQAEFNILKATESNLAAPFRETGTLYWNSPNNLSTNSTKFNARAGGWRNSGADGLFADILSQANWWTSTDNGMGNASTNWVDEQSVSPSFSFGQSPYGHGFSIRPVKDSTILTHGQTGTYTGNDGKVYRTICIGTQEWLADNLAETKFRTGEDIPEVTDNAAWAALTTAGMCAYNNDWSNV